MKSKIEMSNKQESENTKVVPLVKVFTGIRPTGDLTVANYLGAVEPILGLQHQGTNPLVFVADLHAMTDKEPSLARRYTQEVVADYLALGLDPEETDIYVQSDIAPEVAEMTMYLMRHITIAELMRVPTLKEKVRKGMGGETANALLATYPVMMAADILVQKAETVPVGEDQVPHVEVTRLLARRFNEQYGETLYVPRVQQVEAVRIQSLRGEGKMSKTNPEGAIFLTDTYDVIARKVKRAETAFAGEMSSSLASHIVLARGLAATPEEVSQVNYLVDSHMQGKQVMGEFKKTLTDLTHRFVHTFQERKKLITSDPRYVLTILERGADRARKNAQKSLKDVKSAMSR